MTKKLFIGILLAPLSFAMLLLLASFVLGAAGPIGFVFTLLIGYPLAIVVGLPVYFLMRKLKANGIVSYTVAAVLFGTLLISAFILYPVHYENGGNLDQLFLPDRLKQAAFLMFGSFLTVFTFWLIVRPDKLPGK